MTGNDTSSDHPPHLPTAEEDMVSRLRLLRSRRVGVATYRRLMTTHASAEAALASLPKVAADAGVSDYVVCPYDVAIAEIHAGRKIGAQLVMQGTSRYPLALCDMADAPPLFWALGDLSLLQRRAIALVGARNASSLGTRMAKRLAADLAAAGIAVVSGLARGIDTAAHQGALEGGTIAVQAGGVDVIYPAENAQLAHDIAARGLRVAEMPMGVRPQARHFPARNRIIAGLAQAVVVVEAAAKSGSLITARNALDCGRDVLAVPGHPFDARAWGCNMLIREGATLVRNADDVIEALGGIAEPPPEAPPTPSKPKTRPLHETAKLHRMILDRLGPSPVAEDQLLRDLKADADVAAPALIDLELAGKIRFNLLFQTGHEFRDRQARFNAW